MNQQEALKQSPCHHPVKSNRVQFCQVQIMISNLEIGDDLFAYKMLFWTQRREYYQLAERIIALVKQVELIAWR